MRIDGKIALITGASEGIGAACAAEFIRAGAKVSLTARSEDRLRIAGGRDALITPGDLTDDATRRLAVERTIERFGRIDILINNAGIGSYYPSSIEPMEATRRLMELNFFAPLALTQLVVPHMLERGSGMIVNVGSIASMFTLPWMTTYSASKQAVAGFTDGLRMELWSDPIQVMLACPVYVKTGFQKRAAGSPPPGVARARSRAISAEECARMIRRGVERNARTVVAPPVGWLLVVAARLFPSLFQSIMAKLNKKPK